MLPVPTITQLIIKHNQELEIFTR